VALRYLQYDVFTSTRMYGNQLAVFPVATGIQTALMQRIALEMNFPESTFIMPTELAGTDIRMRIFTPRVEMPMAGHPTIGSTFALAELGVIAPGAKRFVFHLNVGPTPVALEWNADGKLAFAWMTQATPTFGPVASDRRAVAEALGVSFDDLLADVPAQQISCGVPFLLVALRDRAAVDRAVPDSAALRRLAAVNGFDLPVFLYSVTASESGADVYSRMFAPQFGIVEDSATGAASGPVGCHLVRYGLISPSAAPFIVSNQGVQMGRASRVHIAIATAGGAISDVRVGGQAVLVGRGELLV